MVPTEPRVRRARLSVRRFAILSAFLLPACGQGEDARVRGDRLWADSNYAGALAEYRLALRQGGAGEAVLLRVAHAYVRTGQAERAVETYRRLLARAPEYEDQAVYDYLTLAERARARGDRYGLAQAVEAALVLRPDVALGELAAPLARYHAELGRGGQALDFYERALLAEPPDSVPALLYEMGRLYEAQGDCTSAVDLYSAHLRQAPGGERAGEAAWRIGSCSFQLARAARQAGDVEEALRWLERVRELGVPENLQDEAAFELGETLFELGRLDEALAAYREVLVLSPAGTGRTVERARQRIDEIRFGR